MSLLSLHEERSLQCLLVITIISSILAERILGVVCLSREVRSRCSIVIGGQIVLTQYEVLVWLCQIIEFNLLRDEL
jgi:hypothetical protein